MKKIIIAFVPVVLFLFLACNSKDYKQTDSGLTYKHHKNNKGRKALIDEVVKMDMAYRYPEDSLIFHSTEFQPTVYITVQPSEYEGDIFEGLRMMSVGDSASFRFVANDFFTKTLKYPATPDFIKGEDFIFVDIIVHEIFNKEEFQAQQQKERQAFIEEQEKDALQEDGVLANYLQENNITTQPEESGLIIIVGQNGNGPKPQAGQTIKVHYTGKLLDGTVFDSSVERGEPIEFVLGRGQVIRGWDEGLSKINVGSKAQFIIPSHLAYGDQERGRFIKPYSTLVFDVELIGVN